MKRQILATWFAFGLPLIGGTTIAEAEIIWSSQEFFVTSSSNYWDGSCRLVDGNVTDVCSDNKFDSEIVASLPSGSVISAESSISNPAGPANSPAAGVMSTTASAEMTGISGGFSMHTDALAEDALSAGVYNSSKVFAESTAGFLGSFSSDDTVFVIDFSSAYALFVEGLEDIGSGAPVDSDAEHSLEVRILMGSDDSEESDELLSLYEEVGVIGSGRDELVEPLDLLEKVAVTPGVEYWVDVSVVERAIIYNMGEAGHLSFDATVDFSSNSLASVPLPGGFLLFGSAFACLGVAGFRKKEVASRIGATSSKTLAPR